MNYMVMRMEFQDKDGKRLILRGMSIGAPKIVSNQYMDALFRNGYVACAP
jgi:hypothetical protein